MIIQLFIKISVINVLYIKLYKQYLTQGTTS